MNYALEKKPTITLPLKAKNAVIEELLANYTYGTAWNVLYQEAGTCITMGNYQVAEYDEAEYVLNITEGGVYIAGRDFSATMRGFTTFLEKITYDETTDLFYVESGCFTGRPLMDFRAVHFCIFPETKLEFLKKCVRSCAIVKYSHIILEFWGMLKYDCMKALAWPFAYTKDQVKEIVAEANALGVEIIPMFNHLGHASSCREINGKHVVLDQNPKYEYLFDSYGWVWNIRRQDVKDLLKQVRNELIEICGEGHYFHIGCDEAYAYGHNTDNAKRMADYVNEVAEDLKQKGRRVILWADMMLAKTDFSDYEVNADKAVSDILLERLDKSILVADWQYGRYEGIWATSQMLKENGFEVVCCPWNHPKNTASAVDTVTALSLSGMIYTTWHTLYKRFREMIYAGELAYGISDTDFNGDHRFYCAALARKALPANGDYASSGWSETMMGPGLE